MTLDEEVRRSLLNSPLLYKKRVDVLHHLFCVNGTGLEWIGGELVDPESEVGSDVPEDFPVDPAHSEIKQEGIRRFNERMRAEYERRLEVIDDLVQSDDLRMQGGFYPLSEYSRLMTIPDDVKPDWLAGAREVIEAIFRHEPTGERDDTAEAHAHNVEWADKALRDIQERFGKSDREEPESYREWRPLHGLRALEGNGVDMDFNVGRPGTDFGSVFCWRATLYGPDEMMFVYACDSTFDDFLVAVRPNDTTEGATEERMDFAQMLDRARSFAGKANPAAVPR